jgi:hypothetical protein
MYSSVKRILFSVRGKTYLGELPCDYEGEFGPGIKTLVISLYYGGNMTQGKLIRVFRRYWYILSAGYLSNLLIQPRFRTSFCNLFTYVNKLQKAT